MSTEVFVAVSTVFEHKMGHMSLTVIGCFPSWKSALKAALESSRRRPAEEGEDENENDEGVFMTDANLPSTEGELDELLPRAGYIWRFNNGECAEWWDGDGAGSGLYRVEKQQMQT